MKTVIPIKDAVSSLLENCLRFRAHVDLNEATFILQNFDPYNRIPECIAEIVNDLKRDLGPIAFIDKNPNNGSFENIRFEIGNENSLVLYITSNLFYRKSDTTGRHADVLHELGARYSADETTVTVDGNNVTARLWWD